MTAPRSRPSGCRYASWAVSGTSTPAASSRASSKRTQVLPTELVLRGSTGRPAAVALPDARRTDRRAAS